MDHYTYKLVVLGVFVNMMLVILFGFFWSTRHIKPNKASDRNGEVHGG